MKFTIISGDNNLKSKQILGKLLDAEKKVGSKIIYINEGAKLTELITSRPLFNENIVFVCRDYQLLSNVDLKWLSKNEKYYTNKFIIFSYKAIPRKKIAFENVEIIENNNPKIIFKLLDSFYPKNERVIYFLFREVKKVSDIEYIFYMLTKHIRDLIWVKIDPSNIPMASWRILRLENISNKYTFSHLNKILNKLAMIDIMVKTGKGDLNVLLDLLIARELE